MSFNKEKTDGNKLKKNDLTLSVLNVYSFKTHSLVRTIKIYKEGNKV